jgi:cytochrome c peroxidase
MFEERLAEQLLTGQEAQKQKIMKATGSLSVVALAIIALAAASCKREQPPQNLTTQSAEVPLLPQTAEDYPVSTNDNMATLGRVLFYDKQLSLNSNISCGSCHIQEKAFCDNLQFSPGTDGHMTHRNTPAIFPKPAKLFWDGRGVSLQDMVLRPVAEPVEMNQNLSKVVSKIRELDYYQHLFKQAFPRVDKPDTSHIRQALAEFIRNFTFNSTKFGQSQNGNISLTGSEETGKNLFFGKAKCSTCHNLSVNNGVVYYGPGIRSHNIGLDEFYSDPGVGAISKRSEDNGAFIPPVLLNVALTAPYMHDGRFKTLEEVVEHYNTKVQPHPALDPLLKDYSGKPLKLGLTTLEKTALVDFLKTLTDPSFTTDKKYSNPFIARVN